MAANWSGQGLQSYCQIVSLSDYCGCTFWPITRRGSPGAIQWFFFPGSWVSSFIDPLFQIGFQFQLYERALFWLEKRPSLVNEKVIEERVLVRLHGQFGGKDANVATTFFHSSESPQHQNGTSPAFLSSSLPVLSDLLQQLISFLTWAWARVQLILLFC